MIQSYTFKDQLCQLYLAIAIKKDISSLSLSGGLELTFGARNREHTSIPVSEPYH